MRFIQSPIRAENPIFVEFHLKSDLHPLARNSGLICPRISTPFLAKHFDNGFRSPCFRYHSRYIHWQTQ